MLTLLGTAVAAAVVLDADPAHADTTPLLIGDTNVAPPGAATQLVGRRG